MSQLVLLGNPKGRSRKKKKPSSAYSPTRRVVRKLSPLQKLYFGPSRYGTRAKVKRLQSVKRYGKPAVARSFHALGFTRNPKLRRNPISVGSARAALANPSVRAVSSIALNAAIGAAGAIGVDAIMGQASRILPASATARYSDAGGINPIYYGVKSLVAIGLGIAGVKFAPAALKNASARVAEGSLTVQAYEVMRAVIPPEVVALGFARRRVNGVRQLPTMRGVAATMRGVGNVRAFLPRPRPTAAVAGLRGSSAPAVVGSTVRSVDGYSL